MSDLRVNKILGAALATGLVILGLKTVSELVFETHAPEKPGYAVAIQEEAAEGGAAAAETPPDWGTVLASADTAAGQTVSTKCASCHTFTSGGANTIGPNLFGVVANKPASHPGFTYSPAMTGFGAKQPIWDYEHLYEYLKAPQGYVPGTKMTFVGLKKPEDRINLIAWLRSQDSTPAPIPAPNPAAAAGAPAPTAASPEGATPAATPGAAPTAAPPGTPAQNQTSNPTGQTPAAGAAAAPNARTAEPPGGRLN